MPKFSLTARLVVDGAARALEFYCDVFDATVIERYIDDRRGGSIVHSAIDIGGTVVAVVDQDLEWGNVGPQRLGGSAVLLHVTVDDPDSIAARMHERGAEILVRIADQFYGRREGRVRDPFGHLWILGRDIASLEPEEIQRRIDEAGG